MPSIQDKDDYRAAVIIGPGDVSVVESRLPEPAEDEVRIRVEGCGICASNLSVWEGRERFKYPLPPGNPGHEAWGIVDKVGKNIKNFTPGERVTGHSFNAYASHDLAKANDLVVLPDFLDNKPFPGEALGCAMNIFSRSGIQKGHTVAIVGCGFLGLLLIQLAKSKGAKVIAISRREFSLQMAKKAGADEFIKMNDHNQIIEKVKQLTEENFCERVIEATGKELPFNLAKELTAERGKLIVVDFPQNGRRDIKAQTLNERGIDIIDAHERDSTRYIDEIKAAIEAIQKQEMDPFPFITHGYSLEEMETAYKDLTQRPDGFVKGVIINIK